MQFEMNLDEELEMAIQLSSMEKQISEMYDSLGKMRRKLFSEMNDMKKSVFEIQQENVKLQEIIRNLKNEREEWLYHQKDNLFIVNV